jgi:hypothetical protein
MPIFDKRWEQLDLTDNDLQKLQEFIMKNPDAGDIIQGTGGAIKLRWALPNKGKRGGARVIYIDLIKFEKVYFLTCYPKSKQDNLSANEKSAMKEIINLNYQ